MAVPRRVAAVRSTAREMGVKTYRVTGDVLMTPGLSVIIGALKESRKILQCMSRYAIYRITETLRVLLFMTLAILVFNFYPVTAVMILNSCDG